MTKACLAFAFFCLGMAFPLRAFQWETATANGREYVTLQSFCRFYEFPYLAPSGNDYFQSHSTLHTIRLKVGNSDMYLDGVHYVLSFPIESGDHDWLVSRMDVIKLFEPILRPSEISGRHSIRGVVIDAGHGGSDNGATSRFGAEKDYALNTAFLLEKILRGQGLKTVLTRRSDVFIDLYERAHIASLYPDYAFVSIHFNSAMPEARGLETYCLSPSGAASTSSAYLTRSDIQKLPGNDYDPMNILLASMVHTEIIKLNLGDITADRGVKRARFVVIKQNVLPAILVEGGFVSNRMEAAQINTQGYRERLAEAIARGVIKFVNVMGGKRIPMPVPSDENPAPEPSRTIVQTPPASSGLANNPVVPKKVEGAVKTSPIPPAAPKPLMTSKKPPVAPKPVFTPKPTSTLAGATTPKIKKSNTKKPVATTSSTTTQPGSETPDAPLNLSEPAAPTPSPGADKSAAEPDEPPVVNIYSTTGKPSGVSDADSSAVSTSPPVASPPKPGTNATTSPAPPSGETP